MSQSAGDDAQERDKRSKGDEAAGDRAAGDRTAVDLTAAAVADSSLVALIMAIISGEIDMAHSIWVEERGQRSYDYHKW